MRSALIALAAGAAGLAAASVSPGFAQQNPAASGSPALTDARQVVPLSKENLYRGWRSSAVLGKRLRSDDHQDLGIIRNIAMDRNGQIRALIVEGMTGESEFVYSIPWSSIDNRQLPEAVAAKVDGSHRDWHDALPAEQPGTFSVNQVVGDHARLQAGFAYGYVSDVVFDREGKMIAVLVMRDVQSKGGTFAFGFPATTGQWNPAAGYYGLPYVTPEQATTAGIRVDTNAFTSAG